MNSTTWRWCGVGLAAWMAASGMAHAQIVNGDFEAGLSGWTVVDQPGSDGSFLVQTGTTSPGNAATVPAPPQGTQAAMSGAQGPGSHVLYQDFAVPTQVGLATLSFMAYVRSETDFVTPGHLDFARADLNQQVRVDLLLPSTDVFGTTVLQNLFQTRPGNALESGYSLVQSDVTSVLAAHAGQTLRLRFAEVDNVAPQNLGVDAVTLSVSPIPEPSTWLLLAAGLGALGLVRRRPPASV